MFNQHWAWTDKRVETLKKLWADGLSCSQIADELSGNGDYLTRNAVIGKVHRLGLSGRATPHNTHCRPRKSREQSANAVEKQRVRQMRALAKADAPPAFKAEPLPEAAPEDLAAVYPLHQRKTLVELDRGDCHWPVGDARSPEFFFCGAPAGEHSYCRYHRMVATQPAAERPAYRERAEYRDNRRAGQGWDPRS